VTRDLARFNVLGVVVISSRADSSLPGRLVPVKGLP
jgi:hypothetical protein